MSLNSLIISDGGVVYKPLMAQSSKKFLFSSSTSEEQTVFPSHINLSCQMTKPEDQGKHGTCMAFSGTTFVESLLWKLTGEKDEFSADELYNLYFDAWSEANDEVVDSLTRKTLRGEDGKWSTEWPDRYESGLRYQRWIYYDNTPFEFSLTDVDSSGADIKYKYSLYYWIMHYNEPEVRKNHYPDKFSNICEKAKNYLYKKIFEENGVLSDVVSFPFYNGKTITVHEVNPKRIKHHAQLNHMPMKSALDSYVGGHAVVFYNYDISTVYFNSSWDDEKVYKMSFDYKNTSQALSSDHYYYNFKYDDTGIMPNYYGVDSIDFYKETDVQKHKVTNFLSPFFSGKVYGVRSSDLIDNDHEITLIAIPDEGYYFKCWDDQFETGEWQSNIRKFSMTSDISITPWFTDNIEDVWKVMHSLYLMSSDYGQIQCNSYNGELLSGNVPLKTNLSCQDTKWKYNSNIELQVIPNQDYDFICWNDGVTNNPRTFNMTSDKFAYPLLSSKA